MINPNVVAGALSRAALAQRVAVDQKQSIVGQDVFLQYFVDFDRPGEAIVDIKFPVAFTQLPGVTAPVVEMRDNGALVAGSYPQADLGIRAWVTRGDPRSGQLLYLGATIAVFVAGHPSLVPVVHFQVSGPSLFSPTSGTDD